MAPFQSVRFIRALSRTFHRRPWVTAAGLCGGMALGCSAVVDFERVECQSDDQCAAAFPGVPATCDVSGGGFCRVLAAGSCTTNADCRGLPAYGFGYTCDAGGSCVPAPADVRCTRTVPERLLVPGEFSDAIVFGSIVERGFDGDGVLENAAQLAVEQANAADGIEGRRFGMVFCDMTEDGVYDALTLDDAAQRSAEYLQAVLGVAAIHGPTTSGSTELVFESLRDTGTLMISPSATSPDLTNIDNPAATDESPGLLWRTVPPDSLQGQTIADDMRARGVEKVVVVTETSSYGVGLQNFFVDVFRERGGTIAGEVLAFDGEAERTARLTTAGGLLDSGAAEEVLFISGEISDSIAFLNLAASEFLPNAASPKGLFLTDTSKTADIFSETNADVDADVFSRLRLTAPAPGSGAVFDTFAGAYASKFPQDPREFGFLPQAYDAVWLLMYGSAWAIYQEGGVVSGTNIARGLRRVSGGAEVNITGTSWRSARSLFASGMPIDVVGASGDLEFDPATEELLSAPIDVIAVDTCGASEAFVTVDVGVVLEPCM